jgi:hypothetical protein
MAPFVPVAVGLGLGSFYLTAFAVKLVAIVTILGLIIFFEK